MGTKITAHKRSACMLFPKMIQYFCEMRYLFGDPPPSRYWRTGAVFIYFDSDSIKDKVCRYSFATGTFVKFAMSLKLS